MNEIKPGGIFIGKCLRGFEPNLWFMYILLSCDIENDQEVWAAAEFMQGEFGAHVHKFTEGEIHQLGYVGHVKSLLSLESHK